ncbi:MAG: c-type cytochrome biogenesis protein CcmI [Hyphomicrobium sp.]|nr:MAG: c-type cytochrome biogenesis protein CcmI [Hyphomicrobium sp.]
MLLWIGFSVLTAVVVAALVRPLMREHGNALAPAEADMAVYRDQLAEIEADRGRGLIGAVEAEAARAEVARRLLARESAGHASVAQGSIEAAPPESAVFSGVGIAMATLVPLASVALYLVLGSPNLPSSHYEARLKTPAEQSSVAELVAKVEARLRENPEDGPGWDVLAPVYLMQERYGEAANAFARAIQLMGESPKRLGGLGEAHVLAGNGIVNDVARLAYQRLRTLEPERMEPRFWLALAKEQDGKFDLAAADYEALLSEATPTSPWKATVEMRLKAVMEQRGKPGSVAEALPSMAVPAPAAGGAESSGRGPNADDIAAAAQMTPEQRTAMIQGMVDGLAAKLKINGRDLAGWLQLVRAYTVMGRKEDAVSALAAARRNFGGDSASMGQLDGLAKSLGLGS